MDLNKIYFWTATINNWNQLLKERRFKEVIVGSLRNLNKRGLISVFAMVIMPNHVHLIWKLNDLNGKELPSASFTKFTAHQFKQMIGAKALQQYRVKASNKDFEFWQKDSLAFELYSPSIVYQKLDYIHNNPLQEKWTLVKDPVDYEYSSAAFYEKNSKRFSFLTHIGDQM